MKRPLASMPARSDLSDREVAKVLGGFVTGMLAISDVDSVRNAVRWWAETDAAWEHLSSANAWTPTMGLDK